LEGDGSGTILKIGGDGKIGFKYAIVDWRHEGAQELSVDDT